MGKAVENGFQVKTLKHEYKHQISEYSFDALTLISSSNRSNSLTCVELHYPPPTLPSPLPSSQCSDTFQRWYLALSNKKPLYYSL